MSIAGRFINIVKQKVSDKDISQSDSSYLTKEQIEDLLADESDATLRDSINNLTQSALPPEVKNAFNVLNIPETKDMEVVATAFRQQMQIFHPDKNPDKTNEKQKELQDKTSEIIKAYNIIKNYQQ